MRNWAKLLRNNEAKSVREMSNSHSRQPGTWQRQTTAGVLEGKLCRGRAVRRVHSHYGLPSLSWWETKIRRALEKVISPSHLSQIRCFWQLNPIARHHEQIYENKICLIRMQFASYRVLYECYWFCSRPISQARSPARQPGFGPGCRNMSAKGAVWFLKVKLNNNF